MIERLTTDRLLLRRPTPEDAAAYVAYYGSDWRATHGPVMAPEAARRRFSRILDHWTKNGYGRFVVELAGQPGPLGLFGPHWPDAYPEEELTGQIWTPDALGVGIGVEAMEATRRHAYEHLGWTTAVTYVHPENAPAIRMVGSLGARLDASVHAPAALAGHDAWRHPGPADSTLSGRRRAGRPRPATPPTLTTPRLTLRPFRIEDFEPYAAFLASPRAAGVHGPYGRETAWAWFTNVTAHWQLYGYGGLMIEAQGRPVGQVAITRGISFPEPELGWFLFEGAEGKGYATEAALALRTYAYETAGLSTLVSYCDPTNAATIAVATRLGCTPDPDASRPAGAECLVFRHPSADADGSVEAYA